MHVAGRWTKKANFSLIFQHWTRANADVNKAMARRAAARADAHHARAAEGEDVEKGDVRLEPSAAASSPHGPWSDRAHVQYVEMFSLIVQRACATAHTMQGLKARLHAPAYIRFSLSKRVSHICHGTRARYALSVSAYTRVRAYAQEEIKAGAASAGRPSAGVSRAELL